MYIVLIKQTATNIILRWTESAAHICGILSTLKIVDTKINATYDIHTFTSLKVLDFDRIIIKNIDSISKLYSYEYPW